MKQTGLSVCLNYESKSWVWLDFIGKICHKSLYQTLVCESCLLDRECTSPYFGNISWRPFYTKVNGTFLFSSVKTSYNIRYECQAKGFGLIIMTYVTYLNLIIEWQPELCRVRVLGQVQDVGWVNWGKKKRPTESISAQREVRFPDEWNMNLLRVLPGKCVWKSLGFF